MAKPPAAAAEESAKAASRAARKERRRDRTREEILAAARKVLIGSGVGAMTLEAVAAEAGMSKTGLYYYFPSKDALVFELIYATLERQARAVEDAVEEASDGGDALRAIIRETVRYFAPRLDDFRLAFLFGQVAAAGEIAWSDEQFARLRPLNDLLLAGASARLRAEWKGQKGRAGVEPRLLAFLAFLAAVGVLTVKGMVERVDDPLLYSDEELTEGLARIFAAATAA
jgi:AcrR family transcriptional regulator